ncbi:MAG: hypothetical protein K2F61_01210 [Muribaculaceae bacterium]|nr:hypothetical protein [Muribaculaceae bacterium]
MKKMSYTSTCIAAATLLTALAACDSEAKLAREVTGTWASTPEKLIDSDALSAATIHMIQFTPSLSDNKSGDLQMTELISVTNAVQTDTISILEPYSVSAAGLATLNGSWAVIDDDEISLHLDESTLDVSIDPDATLLSINELTNATTTSVDSLKPIVTANLKRQITQLVKNRIFDINKIDDIKITGNLMSCEINRRDITFRRQDSVIK